MIKERYKKYAAIIQRAKEEGLHVNDKLSVLMNIESADRKFNIRLDEWLQADLFLDSHLKNRNSREIIEWKIIKNKGQT